MTGQDRCITPPYSPTILELQPQEDYASVRYRLGLLTPGRIVLVLPWDTRFPSRLLDFVLLSREAKARRLQIAIVTPDPQLREVASQAGLPVFGGVAEAQSASNWRARTPRPVVAPKRRWWEETISLRPLVVRPSQPWLRWLRASLRLFVFLVAVAVLLWVAYLIVPRADVTVLPAGREVTTIVMVSVDPDLEEVNHVSRVIPARRVGIEVEGYMEVPTTGLKDVAAGRAVGEVLFTNLLAEDYTVPAGTLVRTSSTSYPIRFRTTADVTVPAGGQATAPIEAIDENTGNVGAFQINVVEGMAASAVRVINPQSTKGAEPREARVVVQADYDRVRSQLTRQLLDQAYAEMNALDFLEPSEFVPRDSLRIEAVPKQAYTRFVGEQADTVGLNLRLLVSGLAVDIDNAESVAYVALKQRLPPGYMLVNAHFEMGEVAEEDIGEGRLALFVTAYGYAAATLDTSQVVELVRGRSVSEARERLMAQLPLAQPPLVYVWPEQLRRLPLLPLRIKVNVRIPTV